MAELGKLAAAGSRWSAHLKPKLELFEVWELMPLTMMMFCRMLISPGVIRVKD